MEVVERGLLEEIAALNPVIPRPETNGNQALVFDLARWIDENGIRIKREGEWKRDGYRWVLQECPWNGHTDYTAYIVRLPGGAIAAGCHHNSCQGYGWREFREHFEPGVHGHGGLRGGPGRTWSPEAPIPKSQPWPQLSEEACYGLLGRIVGAIEPYTEADRVAVLANLLAAFGNAIGRGTFFRVGADLHHLKLNVGLVGDTSKGRKGTSWGPVRELMRASDGPWTENRILHGLSSGEGLIHAVRDRVEGEDKNGNAKILDEGVEDKRLLVLEAELAGVLKVMRRDGNTLSAVVRQAWDDGALQTLTKNDPMRATGTHISLIGHITKAELLRYLTETEAANGFANRFLWLAVRRSKELPFGGQWHALDADPLVRRLSKALEFGRGAGEISWGESATGHWCEVYGPLSEGKPGLFGAAVGRAEARVVRLAALYAVMDDSHTLERGHLDAALALWKYAEESARYIFGDATGDPVADRIAEALRASNGKGMTRTEIFHQLKRHKSAEQIDQALALLLEAGRVRMEREDTKGRTAERWFAK